MKALLTEALGSSYVQSALLAGLLSSVALGTAGTFVVINRLASLAGAVAHCVLGGVGFALYAQRVLGWAWLTPTWGALCAAVLSALVLSWIVRRGGERADTAIGALWCAGMAIGLLFMAATPGYTDAMNALFGNVLMVTNEHLMTAFVLDLVLLSVLALCWRPLYAMSLDEPFARLRGVPTGFYHALLMVLVALTIVMLMQVVGIILVLALLTLPSAIAGRFTQRLWPMMGVSVLVGGIVQSAGLFVGYATDLPAGPCIVVMICAVYALSFLKGRG